MALALEAAAPIAALEAADPIAALEAEAAAPALELEADPSADPSAALELEADPLALEADPLALEAAEVDRTPIPPGELARLTIPAPFSAGVDLDVLVTALVIETMAQPWPLALVAVLRADGRPALLWVAAERLDEARAAGGCSP